MNSAARQQDAILPVLKRVLSENARDYVGLYIAAIACLLAVAGATAFIPWVMRH